MNIVTIAFYTVLRNIRDRKSVFQMLVFPVVLIFILGSALNTAFSPFQLDQTDVALLNDDAGGMSSYFEGFLMTDEIRRMLNIIKINSYEEGIDLLTQRKVVALIYLEKDYSVKYQMNAGEIKVITSQFATFRKTIVQNIVESYGNGSNAVEATIRISGDAIPFTRKENLNQNIVAAANHTPSSMDYYGVTMLVMILMYGASYGLHGFAQDRFDSIGNRIKALPVRSFELYVGKSLGVVVTLFFQGVVLVLFTKNVYGVNWGSNFFVIMFICLTLAILTTGIGILICSVSPDRKTAVNVINIFVPAVTFIAGGYAPLPSFGALMDKLKLFSPNYLAQRAFFIYIYEGSLVDARCFILGLWGMVFITFTASVLMGRRHVQ